MEAPLQQRIVGAIVLVTLGVIFIPALLDGSGYKTRQAKDIVIREKPKFPPLSQKKLNPIPTPLKPTVTSKADSRVALNQDSKLSSKLNSKAKQASKPVTSKPKSVVKSKLAVKPKYVVKEKVAAKNVTDKEKSKQLESKKLESKQPKSKQRIKSFAIQVGTFDSNENAEKVRDKLRKSGYTAYIQKSKSKTKPSYRVRIGPELDYSVLEKLLVKLKKTKRIDGYIVNHP
jgi:DedD protein